MKNKTGSGKAINCNQSGKHHKFSSLENLEMGSPNPEKVYKYFFDNSDDMLCIAGVDGYFQFVNPALEKILGYTREELFSMPIYDFVHPEERNENLMELHSMRDGSPLTYCEHRYTCKDGSLKWLAWSAHTDAEDGLIYAVAKDITERKELENEIHSLKKHFFAAELEHKDTFTPIITRSNQMLAVFHYIEAVAGSQRSVLITGETGVGKELIARVLHEVSGAAGDLVSVNIAGLDDTMFSDTLFGHRKGAFTGADTERSGFILKASEGTLHLDEIGDLNELSQVKLLRLLEEKTYYQLGSDASLKSRTRIIASFNKDIAKQVAEGKFRQDLYYRLCTHHIHIPPLRERIEDIPLLLDHFIEEASNSMDRKKPQLSRELIILLSNYQFPGNIRELQAMVHDAVAQHDKGNSFLDHFKRYIKHKGAAFQSDQKITERNDQAVFDFFGHFPSLKEAETYLISDALKRSDGNQGIAASLLGISRQALNRRLKRKE
jgi:PAS domain S-box-containing protein